MIVNSRTPFGMCRPIARAACASPYERGQQKPCGNHRAYNKAPVNEFQFVCPLYNGFFARCFPSAPRRQYCQLRGFRFASGSFYCRSVPLFLCSAPHRYNHIIAERQKNASGIRARAYNVIYIKRRFSCVVFTKTACAIGYFVV